MSQASFIEVDNLHFARGSKQIFNGLSLNIEKGQITGIMGPSGTGKTTLLKLIGGQLTPDKGCVRVDGQQVDALSRNALFELRERMGMLFQSGALFTDMSVYENIAFPIRAHTDYAEEKIAQIVQQKLESIGLDGTQQMMPSELSGGMKRRVALARAIALNPELIMYDEPFAGQDPIVMGVLVRLIRQLREQLDLTTIIISHDVEETLSIADYVYIIAQGEVQGHGTPDELRHSDHAFIKQFLTGSIEGPVPFTYNAAHSVMPS